MNNMETVSTTHRNIRAISAVEKSALAYRSLAARIGYDHRARQQNVVYRRSYRLVCRMDRDQLEVSWPTGIRPFSVLLTDNDRFARVDLPVVVHSHEPESQWAAGG